MPTRAVLLDLRQLPKLHLDRLRQVNREGGAGLRNDWGLFSDLEEEHGLDV
jgi:hypothetical protein